MSEPRGQSAWMVHNGRRERVSADEFNHRIGRGWVFEDPNQPISFIAREGGTASVGRMNAEEYARHIGAANERGVRLTPVSPSTRRLTRVAMGQDQARSDERLTRQLGEIEGAPVTFGRNLADTLTFGGLSGVLRRTEGEIYDQMAQAGNQTNRVSAGLGVATGLLGPALVSGGASLLARGAGAGLAAGEAGALLATRAGIQSQLGNAVRYLGPSGLAEFGGETLSNFLRARGAGEGVATIAGMTAEGFADGGLTAYTLANMENRELTAQQFFGDAGLGAALGFGFGSVTTGFRNAAMRLAARTPGARAVNEGRIIGQLTDDELARQIRAFRDGTEKPTPEGLMSFLNRFRLSNRDAESVANMDLLTSPQGIRALQDFDAKLPEVSRRLASALDDSEEAALSVISDFRQGRHIDDSMFGAHNTNSGELSRAMLQDLGTSLQKIRQAAGRVDGHSVVDNVSELLSGTRSRLRSETGQGIAFGVGSDVAPGGLVADPKIARANYQRLVALRNEIDSAIGGANKLAPEYATSLQDVLTKVNQNIHSPVWGEAAGLQKAVDEAIEGSGKGLTNFKKALGATDIASGERVFSPDRLIRRLAQTGEDGEDAYLRLEQAKQALENLTKVGRVQSRNAKRLENAIGRIDSDLVQTEALAYVKRIFNKELKKEIDGGSLGRMMLGASQPAVTALVGAIGGQIMGPAGLIVAPGYAAASALLRPVSSVQRFAGVSRMMANFSNRYSGAMKLIERALDSSGRLMNKVVPDPATQFSVFASYRNHKDLLEQYNDVQAELDDLKGNPEMLMARLEQQTHGLAKMDADLAVSFQAAMLRAMEYLEANKPRSPQDPLGLSEKIPPSATELGEYMARVNAIDDPISVLVNFATGRLTQPSVEALQYVHPDLYGQFAAGVTQLFISRRGRIPYQARLLANTFFGVPDPTMDPYVIMRLQSNYSQTEQQTRAIQQTNKRAGVLRDQLAQQQSTRATNYENRQ